MQNISQIEQYSTSTDLGYSFYGGSAPLVVFVHGVLDRGRSFLRIKSRLTDQAVLLYDRRGYGDSPVIDNLIHSDINTIQLALRDLEILLDGRQTILVGHSFGAVVSLKASLEIKNVLGCVIYEPPLSWLSWWVSPLVTAGQISQNTKPTEAVEMFMTNSLGQARWTKLSDKIKKDLYSRGEILIKELTDLRKEAPFDVDKITAPMVLACGSESNPRQKRGIEYLGEHILNSKTVEILGAKHNAHMTHYKDFANLIESSVSYICNWSQFNAD